MCAHGTLNILGKIIHALKACDFQYATQIKSLFFRINDKLLLNMSKNTSFQNTEACSPIRTALANSAKFRGIRLQTYIGDLL